ncbi:MAG: LptF/LptG family permease [Chlamydiia bacterium]|nr:LptF/LptG family permease [Chlamydiia bacterium]
MILTSIWERYFLREIAKGFTLFILGFYFLYVLIDYSSHAKAFAESNIPLHDVCLFYLCTFFRRVDLILPFGLLLATCRTMCTLNLNNELVAMLTSGIPIKTLTRPFVAVGLVFVALMYLNQEYLLPISQVEYRFLEDTYLKEGQKSRRIETQAFSDIQLHDGSTLLYQNYDSAQQHFFDVFWVRSADDIYRIKYLSTSAKESEGTYVDHIWRDANGKLTLNASKTRMPLPGLAIDAEILNQVLVQPMDQALSRLWKQIPSDRSTLTEHAATVLTYFHYKLAIPWLSLLVIIGPAPHCLQYSRTLRVFLINALCILALLTFYLIMDTALILGEHQAVPPALAAWAPITCFGLATGWRFLRMR